METFDVVIIGAGLSGIGAAWHLEDQCPGKTYCILESRDAIGGTWDLFRYPGIRSDSDMFTLGYNFRPWEEQKAIADGPHIRDYVQDTAREAGIDQHIRFHHKVTAAAFDSSTARWTVSAETPEGPRQVQAHMLLVAAGYYSFDNPHNPPFDGEDRFAGRIFHAQHWPEDLDYRNKKVVVIGSGATAVTIVPVVAAQAAHVTMLQRSPTWMVSRPAEDWLANALRGILPPKLAYRLIRKRNVLWQQHVFNGARKNPEKANAHLTAMLMKAMPESTVKAHFQPRYNVWEQRLCLVPDGDFFKAVNNGTATVVTDHIDRFDAGGIVLKSGNRLDADIIVKATGITMQAFGGATFSVDGKPVDLADRYVYRGMMVEGMPNLVYVFGYFNASWTLRADLTAEWTCRLINEMAARKADIAVPEGARDGLQEEPMLLSSGYVARGKALMPRRATAEPWRDSQDYLKDRHEIGEGPIEDGVLQFRRVPVVRGLPAEPFARAAE